MTEETKPEPFPAWPEDKAGDYASEWAHPKGSYPHRKVKQDFMEGFRFGLMVAMRVCADHQRNAMANVASYGAALEQQKALTAYGIGIGAEKIAAVLRNIYTGREGLPSSKVEVRAK